MDGRDATDYHSVHGGKIMFSEMRRKKREMDTEAAESFLKCSRRGILAVNGDNMKIVIIHGQSHKGSTYHVLDVQDAFWNRRRNVPIMKN